MLAQRRALSPVEVTARSARVHARLYALPAFQRATQVLTYASADAEVDTFAVIRRLLAMNVEVGCPCAGHDALRWFRISSAEELTPGRFSIPEPDAQRTTPIQTFDSDTVVLVPGIAYDWSGYRIGYGAGFFDRFLADFPGVSIGLAYRFQVLDTLPREHHDIPVDWLVTDADEPQRSQERS